MESKSMSAFLMIARPALLLAATVTVLGAQSATAPAKPVDSRSADPKPAELKPAEPAFKAEPGFKNLQVLKGIAPDQLLPTMQFVAASLGVECQFCHVKDEFDKDDKKPKQVARQMMQMQMAINKENFEGRRVVSCYSCHRGSRDPVAVPVIPDEEPKPADAANAKPKDTPRPTPDQILAKYLQAVGGADAMKQIVSRVEKGTMTFPGGQFPVEVFAKAPDMRISVAHMPGGDQMTAFDGHSGWLGSSARPPRDMTAQESESFRLDADFNFAADLKQIFTQFRAGRPEKVGDAMAEVVIAVRQGQPPLRLYFDQESGLMVRMVRYADTPLGRNPTQIDYADYRDTGGIKIPYRWTVARTNGRFTIQIDQVQQNVAIDDGKFAKPALAAAPAPPAGKAPAGHN